MNTHADIIQANKSQSVANAISQKRSGGESTFQFVDNRPEAIARMKLQELANNDPQVKQAAQLQAMANNHYARPHQPFQQKENQTGLPDNLKAGIERLSGYSMADVKVHYNSDKPAQLQAHAYAQGTDIHVGSGQEKHLPHEAWHVVQQKQGRVKPTLQLKGKVNVNDDPHLEREADVMGTRALQMKAVAKAQLKQVSIQSEQPAQRVLVKLEKARSRGGEDYYVPAKDSDEGAVDTSTLTLEQRQKALVDLGKKSSRAHKEAVNIVRAEIASMTKKVDEEEIVSLGVHVEVLLQKHRAAGALDDKEIQLLRKCAFQAYNAMEFLGNLDEGETSAEKFRVLLLAIMEKISRIDDNILSESRELAGGVGDLNIGAEEIAAYREDILQGPAWGGGAEASAIARAFGQKVRLFILDSQNQYVRVDDVGAPAAGLRTLGILNLGNHYITVNANHANGAAFNREAHQIYNPPGNGDCMFNALRHAMSTQPATVLNDPRAAHPGAVVDDNFVAVAREIAAQGTGGPLGAASAITDAQARLSIAEIIISGQRAGVGPSLGRHINFRRHTSKSLRDLITSSGIEEGTLLGKIVEVAPGTRGKSLAEILGLLDNRKSRFEEISAKNAEHGEKFNSIVEGIIDKILKLCYQRLLDEDQYLDVPQSDEFELMSRKKEAEKHRRLYQVNNSPNNEKQLIVTVDGEEFVLDRLGQLVPRYVARSISSQNETELAGDDNGIFPSQISPEKFTGSKGGSGTTKNVLETTPEMYHVEGQKPSSFLSTTKEDKGTVNPLGESFGSALYQIDLSFISPEFISDLSTSRGISYYLLANYQQKPKGNSKGDLIGEAVKANELQEAYHSQLKRHEAGDSGVKKPEKYDADVKAAENSTLSGKEWQALMDVVRTSEILISCKVPGEAMKKK